MTSQDETVHSLFLELIKNITALKQIYDFAISGQKEVEKKVLKHLEKLGSGSIPFMTEEEQDEAMSEGLRKDPVFSPFMTEEEQNEAMSEGLREDPVISERFLIANWNHYLTQNKALPGLARKQLLVLIAANFEGYVAEALIRIFRENPNILKSKKHSTLTDEEIIDAMLSGEYFFIHMIAEKKVDSIMRQSPGVWFSSFEDRGFKIDDTDQVIELFLVRNCVVHNNAKVSEKLKASSEDNRFKNVSEPIELTDMDMQRFFGAAVFVAAKIDSEYERKFKPALTQEDRDQNAKIRALMIDCAMERIPMPPDLPGYDA